MLLSQKEKEIVRTIYFNTSLTETQIEECLHGLAVSNIYSMYKGEKVTIPFFGNFLVKFNGANIKPESETYNVSLFGTPSELFKKIAYQVDCELKNSKASIADPAKWILSKIKQSFRRNIDHYATDAE